MNLEGFDPDTITWNDLKLSEGDQWILHRLNETTRETNAALAEYRFNEAAMGLYQFTWSEFCDWYLELSKQDLYGSDCSRKLMARYILWYVLEHLLRLLHPFMPFITEEIWQALPPGSGVGVRGAGELPETVMRAAYPEFRDNLSFAESAGRMERVMAVIGGIRNIRGEMEVPPSKNIAVILSCDSEESLRLMKHSEGSIISLARISDLAIGQGLEKPEDASIQVAGDVQIFVPLKGMVDVEAEEPRLLKEIAKTEKDIELFSKKLENPSFVDRAPADIVAKEKEKLAVVTAKKEVLEASLGKIRKLR
jgi:valyl-tRNA synthetase